MASQLIAPGSCYVVRQKPNIYNVDHAKIATLRKIGSPIFFCNKTKKEPLNIAFQN